MSIPTFSHWRKSSRSGAGGSNCVEVGFSDHDTGVRDTKDRSYGTLVFQSDKWRAFMFRAKSGELDRHSVH